MSRIIAAVILVGALAGCVTSEGPYSRSAMTSLAPQRPAPAATNRPAKPTQTAEAPRRQIQRAEYPIILGTAF
jgi:hypothetical protein